MASEAKEYENVKHGSGHTIDKLENTISDLQVKFWFLGFWESS